MKIDEGEYFEMIKELAGAIWFGAMLYGFVWMGFCL